MIMVCQSLTAPCLCSYKAELKKLIDPAHLPSCYGGTAKFDWPEHKPLAELNY